jgi:two-component system sensor kinase FixL
VCRVISRQGRPSVIGVIQDITERRRLNEFLANVIDEERTRLGTELHDGIGQQLTGIALLSQALARRARTEAPDLAEDLANLARLASDSVGMMRGLSHGMLPFALRETNFMSALREFAESIRHTFRVSVAVSHQGHADCMPTGNKAEQLFRIAKEAVTNALRHGRAKRITLVLCCDPEVTTLSVNDDGSGFDPAKHTYGMGVQIMHHRARMLGGFIEVRSAPRRGTLIKVVVPHRSAGLEQAPRSR